VKKDKKNPVRTADL